MIPYGRQTISDDDVEAVAQTLRGDWLTQGPKVKEFEAALADYCGVKHAVTFSNGTIALQAAYAAAGLGQGDELVTTPLTFAATASAALWLGAKPVFCDVDALTGNLDPEQARKVIGRKTKVLAPVDYSGRPAALEAFAALAKERGLVVVEDACHSLGAGRGLRRVGQLADMTVFSFHPVKAITTGEGGAVVTDEARFASALRAFGEQGVTRRGPDWVYDIGMLGLNGRLTDFQAALGLSQLKKLDGFIERRVRIAARYEKALGDEPGLTLPPGDAQSAWHLYPVRLRLERLTAGRADFFSALRAAGVGVQVHYIPVHRHPLYQRLGYPKNLCPNAEAFYEEELSLPIFPTLTESDQDRVIATLRRLLEKNARAAAAK